MQENQNNNNEVEELDLNHLMQIRRDKLKDLQEQGKNPFEITKFNRTNTAGEIKSNYEKFEEKDVTVTGRIIAKRIMGKASFCTIQDSDEKIQSYVSINDLEDKIKKKYPNRIKELEKNIENYKTDIEYLSDNYRNEDSFTGMTINGITYSEKQDAGAKIIDECKSIISDETKEIGEYKGFKMELRFFAFMKEYNLILKRNSTTIVNLGNSELGNITRIDNALDNISSHLLDSQTELETIKTQLEKAKLEFGKPFSQEVELKEKQKRLNEVNRLLNMNEKTNEILDDDVEEVEQNRQKYKNSYER